MAVGALAGCGTYPRDPDQSLARIRTERLLRIGVAPADPWVLVGDQAQAGAEPLLHVDGVALAGSEVALARAFAVHLGVRAQWHLDGEAGLVEKMELGELDLVAAGLTTSSPWSQRVGLTRAYVKHPDAEGKVQGHSLAVPAGENALLSELERFLDSRSPAEKEPLR